MNKLAFYDQPNSHILGFKRKTIEFLVTNVSTIYVL